MEAIEATRWKRQRRQDGGDKGNKMEEIKVTRWRQDRGKKIEARRQLAAERQVMAEC